MRIISINGSTAINNTNTASLGSFNKSHTTATVATVKIPVVPALANPAKILPNNTTASPVKPKGAS